MLDIGWSEMFVILVVALIVIGPKDLPRVARTLGKWIGKGRALAREFQSSIEDMAREAELDEVKKDIERAGRTDLRKSVERTIDPKGELKSAFDPGNKGASSKAGKSKPALAKPKRTGDAPAGEVAGPPAPGANGAGGAPREGAEPEQAAPQPEDEPEPKRVAAGSS